ncbi:MAG: tyrosine-type recombinase/integrase, partial [Rhizobiaceae bacterium]
MLEDHVKSPSTRRRLLAVGTRAQVDAFVAFLVEAGYSPVTVEQTCRYLAVLTGWVRRHGFDDDFPAGLAAYGVLAERGRVPECESTARGARRAGKRYVQFLREQGAAPALTAPCDRIPLLGAFHRWGVDQRGLAETTLRLYEDVLVDLVDALGDDPGAYTARNLRDFVSARSRPHGGRRGETIVCAVRAFLRFLVAAGRCRDGLPDAIPRFASWKLSSLPKYLEPAAVQRVLDACAPTTPVLRRDRAILLLLSRLGLRGGDIGRIAFGDLDWRSATIAVAGKSRRRELLPLPQDVGDAILDYIRYARPPMRHQEVFLTARAPHRPVNNGTVSQIARAAIVRSGVNAPSHGAHVFRHSAATAMLQHGA